jgi:hypothetical protein
MSSGAAVNHSKYLLFLYKRTSPLPYMTVPQFVSNGFPGLIKVDNPKSHNFTISFSLSKMTTFSNLISL